MGLQNRKIVNETRVEQQPNHQPETEKKLDDPSFIEHLTRTPNCDYSLIIQDTCNPSDLFLAQFDYSSCTCLALTLPKAASLIKDPITTLVGSCNGLLCICYKNIYYVCNPILGEFMALPRETRSSLQPSAFGFCPNTKEYKVIRFVADALLCKIHTLGTKEWRTITNILPPKTPFSIDSSVNGNFHWITKSQTSSHLICALNLETEKFRYISPPADLNENMIKRISNISVVELGGLLCISYVLDTRFEIWVMENYGLKGSWIKKNSIEFEPSILNYQMKFMNNGDLLINCDKTRRLYSYNTEKGEFRFLMDTGIAHKSVIAHRPSFLSLKAYATEGNLEEVRLEKTYIQKGGGVERVYFPATSSRPSYTLLF